MAYVERYLECSVKTLPEAHYFGSSCRFQGEFTLVLPLPEYRASSVGTCLYGDFAYIICWLLEKLLRDQEGM